MKPLMLALSAACLAFAVAACGGGGAESAGPVPSVPVEAQPTPTSTGDSENEPAGSLPSMGDYYAQAVDYVARADAICRAATDRLEEALTELDPTERKDEISTGDLAFDISGDALAELRALSPPDAPAVNPVALCSHRGGTQESVNPPTRAEYIAQANTICNAASGRLGLIDLNWTGNALEIARIEEEVLAQLRALPQPEADRALLEEAFYSVVEGEIDALRAEAAAQSAGNNARALLLGYERVHLTHQRDGFTIGYGLGWCPLTLPA